MYPDLGQCLRLYDVVMSKMGKLGSRRFYVRERAPLRQRSGANAAKMHMDAPSASAMP